MTLDEALERAFGADAPEGMREALEPQVRILLGIAAAQGDEYLAYVAEQLAVLREHCQSGDFDGARNHCVANGADPATVDMALEMMRPYIPVAAGQ